MTLEENLLDRASVGPKYQTAPGPTDKTIERILHWMQNAPCHDEYYPFRLVLCENRDALGEIFLRELPEDADEAIRQKARQKAQKGPTCFALILRETPNLTRRERDEQLLSAGAALMRLLDALHTAGFVAKTVSGKDFRSPVGLYDAKCETLLAFVLAGNPVEGAKRNTRKPINFSRF